MNEQTFNLSRALAEVVSEAGGHLDSRVRIQKLCYILRALREGPFVAARFRYHYYGPYSNDVSGALQDAVNIGFLREKKEELGEGQLRYGYDLDVDDPDWLEKQGSLLSVIGKRALRELKDEKVGVLELLATVLYVQEQERVTDFEAALARALVLKPNCMEYSQDATRAFGVFKSLSEQASIA